MQVLVISVPVTWYGRSGSVARMERGRSGPRLIMGRWDRTEEIGAE